MIGVVIVHSAPPISPKVAKVHTHFIILKGVLFSDVWISVYMRILVDIEFKSSHVRSTDIVLSGTPQICSLGFLKIPAGNCTCTIYVFTRVIHTHAGLIVFVGGA